MGNFESCAPLRTRANQLPVMPGGEGSDKQPITGQQQPEQEVRDRAGVSS